MINETITLGDALGNNASAATNIFVFFGIVAFIIFLVFIIIHIIDSRVDKGLREHNNDKHTVKNEVIINGDVPVRLTDVVHTLKDMDNRLRIQETNKKVK